MKHSPVTWMAVFFVLSSSVVASDIKVWLDATDFGSSEVTVGTGCPVYFRVFVELGDVSNQGLALVGFDLEFDGGSLEAVTAPTSMGSFLKPDGLTNPAGYGGTPDSGLLLQVGGVQNTIINGQVPCSRHSDCPGTACVGDICDPVAPFPVGTVVTGLAMPGSPQVVAEGVLENLTVEGSYTLEVSNLFANVITADTTGVPFWKTAAATPAANTPLSITVESSAFRDAVQQIQFSVPPSGAFDAREPHDVSDASALTGWQSVEITMSDVVQSCLPLEVSFTLHEVGGDGVAPSIESTTVVASSTVRIDFDAPIEPGTWTVVRHDASGSSVCLGYLPADANGDGLAATSDINALIDSINLVSGRVLPDYSTDMNRSGITNGQDILRIIDLMNGAGKFDVWIAASLPENPCAPS